MTIFCKKKNNTEETEERIVSFPFLLLGRLIISQQKQQVVSTLSNAWLILLVLIRVTAQHCSLHVYASVWNRNTNTDA